MGDRPPTDAGTVSAVVLAPLPPTSTPVTVRSYVAGAVGVEERDAGGEPGGGVACRLFTTDTARLSYEYWMCSGSFAFFAPK